MGRTFDEHYIDEGRAPYKASTICFCLTQYVRNYIREKRKVIANIDANVRDAVLVDSINYLGTQGCCDFALYTKDLYSGRVDEEKVDAQNLLTIVFNHYSMYLFSYEPVESVLRNKHMNNCKEKFDVNDAIIVIVDFINYLSEVNGFDRRFTVKDLYDKFKLYDYRADMKELKSFLEKTSLYGKRLLSGENIDKIFDKMARKYDLGSILEDGTYNYAHKNILLNRSEMFPWDKRKVEDEIYAMSYAYAKTFGETEELPQTEIINKKILEMKVK